jgi:hypothetical protein
MSYIDKMNKDDLGIFGLIALAIFAVALGVAFMFLEAWIAMLLVGIFYPLSFVKTFAIVWLLNVIGKALKK